MLDVLFGLIFALFSTLGIVGPTDIGPAHSITSAKSGAEESAPATSDSGEGTTDESGGFPVIVG